MKRVLQWSACLALAALLLAEPSERRPTVARWLVRTSVGVRQVLERAEGRLERWGHLSPAGAEESDGQPATYPDREGLN